MTFGSLFSGIGGLDLGLERAGFRAAWQVEINPFRRKVLEKHWRGVRRHDDVKTFLADADESGQSGIGRPWQERVAECRVDLICGGFPCQPVSCAGRRRGDADDRWLWPEMRRVCAVVRPRWVLVENVRGLLSASSGRLFGTVVRDLADLGYLVEWSCISAAALGAPHIRDRVWILGHSSSAASEWDTGGLPSPQAGERGARQFDGDLPKRSANAGELADALSGRHKAQGRGRGAARQTGHRGRRSANGGAVADALQAESPRWACLGPDTQQELAAFARGCRERYWASDPADDPESGMGRVAYGIPNRVERIAGLGDSVVPQVAEFIGRRLLAAIERRAKEGM